MRRGWYSPTAPSAPSSRMVETLRKKRGVCWRLKSQRDATRPIVRAPGVVSDQALSAQRRGPQSTNARALPEFAFPIGKPTSLPRPRPSVTTTTFRAGRALPVRVGRLRSLHRRRLQGDVLAARRMIAGTASWPSNAARPRSREWGLPRSSYPRANAARLIHPANGLLNGHDMHGNIGMKRGGGRGDAQAIL